MRNLVAIVVIAGATGGLLAGGFLAGRSAARDGRAATQAQQRELEEIRASIDVLERSVSRLAALRAVPANADGATGAPLAAEVAPRAITQASAIAPPRPAEQELAWRREAETLFADAFSRGRWSPGDDDAFTELRVASPAMDWAWFELKLAAAVNAGQLQRVPMNDEL